VAIYLTSNAALCLRIRKNYLKMPRFSDEDLLRIYPKIIDKVKYSLTNWAFADIRRASSGGAKLGAFILASCYIDYLSGYYFGGESTRSNYIDFCRIFLPKYNANDLYKSVRCRLVHNYSLESNCAFTHHHYKLHLRPTEDGKTVLNLGSFVNDLSKAMELFFSEVDKDPRLKVNFARRYKTIGTMSPHPLAIS